MTSQKDQIQSLINDIERALSARRSNKPWVRASDVEPQREVLTKAQDYLRSLQQTFEAPGGWGPVNPSTGQIADADVAPTDKAAPSLPTFSDFSDDATLANGSGDRPGGSSGTVSQTAENVLQALLTEMKYLKSSALEPLRVEMDELRSQRDRLQAEVKSLDEQRAAASSSLSAANSSADFDNRASSNSVSEEQLNDFLTALMGRLQENLTQQVGQTLSQLESDHAAAIARLAADDEAVLQLRGSGQIEELRQLQGRSDQLLVNIDSTLHRMFETLQQNINSYQRSLNEGLENMHSLGRQGEVIVRSLVDHLTAQLGQTAPLEPAFFPARSAEVPLSLADEETLLPNADAAPDNVLADDVLDRDLESDYASDTVSSLNEVLPDLVSSDLRSEQSTEVSSTEVSSSKTPLAASLSIGDSVGDTVDDLSQDLEQDLEQQDLEQQDLEQAIETEDYIREDGSIDLDLLKLDIDRSESAALDPNDVMVDAAIADAQIAATESEDAEIEAKVTPTVESLYLADLTFDDLTVDPELALYAESSAQNAESLLDEVDEVDESNNEDSEDAELAAVLPDLSSDDLESELSEPESSELELLEPGASDTFEERELEASSPEGLPEDIDAQETEDETEAAAEVSAAEATESADIEVSDIDTSDMEVADADSILANPESALVPDIPDVDDDIVDSMPLPSEGVDTLSSSLAVELEAVSREAGQAAAETTELDLDSLTSDLEEAVVFDPNTPEAEISEPQRLLDAAEPLDSAQIPDLPDGEGEDEDGDEREDEDGDIEDSLQASLDESAFAIAGNTTVAENTTERADRDRAAVLLPPDFDDDLDFYAEEDSPETTGDSFSNLDDRLVAEDTAIEDAAIEDGDREEVVEETAANETAVEETAESAERDDLAAASLLEPPLATAPAVVPPVADPIDPFVTVDLERSVDEPSATADAVDPIAVDPVVAAPIVADEPPADSDDESLAEGRWFLGIDIGTTGLSAVLVNQIGEQVYPLCWETDGEDSHRFRLPAIAQMIGRELSQPGFGEQIGEVGMAALSADGDRLLRHIKPLLKVGIPHGETGEPWVQWSDGVALPLQALQSALGELLRSLSAQRASCHAIGLQDGTLRRILANLSGVIVGYPTNWPDTYSFNVREAVLAAGLVARDEQVFFLEEAIATLLSALPNPNMDPEDIDDQQPGLYNCQWSGGTVVLSAGATLTEAAIADLPADLEQLSYRDFAMRSFGYAGDSLDQDIICQLLYAPMQEEGSSPDSSTDQEWRSLGLDSLDLPLPGEVDRAKRYRLRQRLHASSLGRQAIAIAQRLKVDLQEANQIEVSLGDRTWIVKRKDLETKVFLPYIQRVNRLVNGLLAQAEMSAETVKHVVCTGGSASLSAIARWLRQKFPNATIIQDTYSGEYSNSCSRVAYGLANLCHYPNVLDGNRHQYSDYFLLLELLRILPDQPLPAGGILHLLEQRGIDTRASQMHILALIEGHLPPGLVPIESDRPLISAQSPDIPTYEAISELPLFRKQGGQIYIADTEQAERLRQHLESVLAGKVQTLEQPQALQLSAETVQL